jgi:hypothetical protein
MLLVDLFFSFLTLGEQYSPNIFFGVHNGTKKIQINIGVDWRTQKDST